MYSSDILNIHKRNIMKNNTKTNIKEKMTQSCELHKKLFEVEDFVKSIKLDLNKIDYRYQDHVDRLDRQRLNLISKEKNLVKLISEQDKLIEFLENYYLEHCESTTTQEDDYPIYDVLKKYDEIFRKHLSLETKDIDIGLSRMKQTTVMNSPLPDNTDKMIKSDVYVSQNIDENLYHKKIPKITCKNEDSNSHVYSTDTFEMTGDYYDTFLENFEFHEMCGENRLITSTDHLEETGWLISDYYKFKNETKLVNSEEEKKSQEYQKKFKKEHDEWFKSNEFEESSDLKKLRHVRHTLEQKREEQNVE